MRPCLRLECWRYRLLGDEMKLSEAILRGCEMAPKQLTLHGRRGTVQSHNFILNGDCSCAIGAAMLTHNAPIWMDIYKLYGATVCDQVMAENESYTREQIAASLAECGL